MPPNHAQESIEEERVVVDTTPCFVKYSLRSLGIFAGFLCLLLGLLNIIFFWSIGCLFFGLWLMFIGFFVVTTETAGSPVRICFCVYLKGTANFTEWISRCPIWFRATLYIIAPLPSIIFCFSVYTIISGGFLIFAGLAYAAKAIQYKSCNGLPFTSTSTTQNPEPRRGNNDNNFHSASANGQTQFQSPPKRPPPYSNSTTSGFSTAATDYPSATRTSPFPFTSGTSPTIIRPPPALEIKRTYTVWEEAELQEQKQQSGISTTNSSGLFVENQDRNPNDPFSKSSENPYPVERGNPFMKSFEKDLRNDKF